MDQPPTTLKGVIERVSFSNPDNGYTVARFQVDDRFGLVTVVGTLAEVHPGARLALTGRWKTHPKYGEQFQIEQYEEESPATVEGIKRYLGSGLIKGLGPVMAKRIAETFGPYTLEILENDIRRLTEVDGIGPKRLEMIAKAWEGQKQIKEIMLFLQSHQVSTNLAVKIYKTYGDNAIKILKDSPYRLARDIFGIGFLTADKIARDIGIEADAAQRIAAGIEYTLNQLADQGHVFVPRENLVQSAEKILGVKPEQIDAQIEVLQGEDRVKLDRLASTTEAVYLNPFFYAEVGVARQINQLLVPQGSRLALFAGVDWSRVFGWLKTVQRDGITLAEQQRRAVQMALTSKLSILTGGPGTGKTSTVQAVLRLLDSKHKTALLAAPTGRAAKRLAESTGREAKTIHRLLEVNPSQGFQFQRNQDNPLEGDMLIVDECSMVDLTLMNHLLKAVHPASHLLLVGDADQLPSVGAGNVLRDMIASEVIPVTRLDVIFRQAADSTIITNAHRINQGEMPQFPKDKNDFFFFGKEDADEAAELVVDIVGRRIPKKFGTPSRDIQVLSPMHRGAAGVRALNEKLQSHLNPLRYDQPEYRSGSRLFRIDDRVLQQRNNYDKDVFNGDVGRIEQIDLEEGEIWVNFEGRSVMYELSELDELTLAYAMSVHKSQGSEYPVVVLPLLTQHYMLLQRNLLYTAITRAKQMVVVVGTRKAIAIAVKNDKIAARWTALEERLRNGEG
jgi:exodeoxyribonuclease V alpha subunit